MIYRDKASELKYLIIAGAILAFVVLVSSSETFAQFSTFSGSGGYGYPYGRYNGYSTPYGYTGYSRYSYPGYVSWSGPFAYSQDSSQWVPLYQYSSGPGLVYPTPLTLFMALCLLGMVHFGLQHIIL